MPVLVGRDKLCMAACEIHLERAPMKSLLIAVALILPANTAYCGVITGIAKPFTGDPAEVSVTLDDMIAGAGKIQISVNVNNSVALSDLRGLFLHINPESLLTSGTFSVLDPNGVVTQEVCGPANSVINLQGGNNLNGGGSPGPFDIGFEIGSEGIGGNDYQSVAFTLMHSTAALDLSVLANQAFGVRVTSVMVGNSRNGSSKLGGLFPDVPPPPGPGPEPANGTVPEPATLAIWSVLGFVGIGAARRKRTKQS
jgi:hypothetical protein